MKRKSIGGLTAKNCKLFSGRHRSWDKGTLGHLGQLGQAGNAEFRMSNFEFQILE